MDTLTIAAVAWTLRECRGVEDWLAHLDEAVESVPAADIIVLPELVCLELLWGQEGADACAVSDAAFAAWESRCRELALGTGARLVGGSHIVRHGAGYVNRSLVAEPDGTVWYQDKQVMTQFEIADWSLGPGKGQSVHDGLGVAVCYDTEFSRVFEPLADKGALVVAVPSFTETPHGHHRVHTCAAARATEFQVVVAVAPLLGSLGFEPVPSTVGKAAIYAPCVPPFPPDGILAIGEDMAVASFDPAVLLRSREHGDVRNFHDQARLRQA